MYSYIKESYIYQLLSSKRERQSLLLLSIKKKGEGEFSKTKILTDLSLKNKSMLRLTITVKHNLFKYFLLLCLT
jgi:hypothetical protein